MLNGQTFYGKKLKVVMDRCKDGLTILPKGLVDVGLGLGIYGKPLRNIAKHYERYITQRSSLVNPILFTSYNATYITQTADEGIDLSEKVKEIQVHMDNQKKSLNNKNIYDSSSFMVKVDDEVNSDCSESNDKRVNDTKSVSNVLRNTNEIKTITSATRKPLPVTSPVNKNLAKPVPPVRQLVTPAAPSAINPNFINGVSGVVTARSAEPVPPGIEEFRPSVPVPVPVRPMFGPHPLPIRPEFPVVQNPRPMPRPGLPMGPRPMPGPVVRPFLPAPRPPMPNPVVPAPYRNVRPFAPMPNLNSTTVRLRNVSFFLTLLVLNSI